MSISVACPKVPTLRNGDSPHPISIVVVSAGNQLLITAPHNPSNRPPFFPEKIASNSRRCSALALSPMYNRAVPWPPKKLPGHSAVRAILVPPRIAALNVETKCATAPALVRRPLRTKPAWAQHFTTAELHAPPRKLPTHRRCLLLLIFPPPIVSREKRSPFEHASKTT